MTDIPTPIQLPLYEICDCCGGLSYGTWATRHKACLRAWESWLRDDNFDQWRDAARVL